MIKQLKSVTVIWCKPPRNKFDFATFNFKECLKVYMIHRSLTCRKLNIIIRSEELTKEQSLLTVIKNKLNYLQLI